jgi:hypothetical protein
LSDNLGWKGLFILTSEKGLFILTSDSCIYSEHFNNKVPTTTNIIHFPACNWKFGDIPEKSQGFSWRNTQTKNEYVFDRDISKEQKYSLEKAFFSRSFSEISVFFLVWKLSGTKA